MPSASWLRITPSCARPGTPPRPVSTPSPPQRTPYIVVSPPTNRASCWRSGASLPTPSTSPRRTSCSGPVPSGGRSWRRRRPPPGRHGCAMSFRSSRRPLPARRRRMSPLPSGAGRPSPRSWTGSAPHWRRPAPPRTVWTASSTPRAIPRCCGLLPRTWLPERSGWKRSTALSGWLWRHWRGPTPPCRTASLPLWAAGQRRSFPD